MPGMMLHACNPSTWESEAGFSVQGQLGLHCETLPQKKKKKTNKQKPKTVEKGNQTGNKII
jgi:hypothetical protein